ncbi:hypothetical protein SLEP1_g16009 [Rubroshorea leprosula]|uniref:Uncharacterized protein n=1 Tax=Rubroshorea leprosula TaxID=152421 RepID=A0AAV5ITH6_9ROSI|nr:hypothetical protein SLEP1_g16009 [Rubroshorea leprosula]
MRQRRGSCVVGFFPSDGGNLRAMRRGAVEWTAVYRRAVQSGRALLQPGKEEHHYRRYR